MEAVTLGSAIDRRAVLTLAGGAAGLTLAACSEEPDRPRHSRTPHRAELPGGGRTLFPSRRVVALYGRPGSSSMGALGAQGPTASARRVKQLAKRYARLSSPPIMPAFELIATMGTSEPGAGHYYSARMPVKQIMQWIEAARRAGVYVVLDLQPGRAKFLDQAKEYRHLLELPHVGLALDPEWKLTAAQKPLEQIGSVSADEINSVTDWLAKLTAAKKLPQKALVIHQFRTSMISDRAELDTSRDELAYVIHADGHGTPHDKRKTYKVLSRSLPAHTRMGWKNFYQQDEPLFSPRQTYDMRPRPWFVSYQ